MKEKALSELSKHTPDHGTVSAISEFISGSIDENRHWIMGLSLVVSIASFAWQIFKALRDDRKHDKQRRIDKRLSVSEGFWHKTVILPIFVNKFVECLLVWIEKIESCPAEETTNIKDEFLINKRELCRRSQILCTVDASSRSNIRTHLDDIEDSVLSHLYKIASGEKIDTPINQKLYSSATLIFEELIEDHNNVASDY